MDSAPMAVKDLGLAVIDGLGLKRSVVSSLVFQRLSSTRTGARITVTGVEQDAVRGVVKIEETFAMYRRPVYWKPWRRGALERLRLVSVERTEDDS